MIKSENPRFLSIADQAKRQKYGSHRGRVAVEPLGVCVVASRIDANLPFGKGILPPVGLILPEANTSEQLETVKQTIRDLLQGIDDPRRAATLVADVIVHHAPELQEWAQAQLRSR